MPITGFWIAPTKFVVTDTERQKREVITILATEDELKDYFNCQELEHWAREEAEAGWNKEEKEEREGKRPYSNDEKRDLAGTLREIRASRVHQRETGHTRWW